MPEGERHPHHELRAPVHAPLPDLRPPLQTPLLGDRPRKTHDHHQVHTHAERLSFLKKVTRTAPKDVAIEIVADNYTTHKHQDVVKWLEKHPRVHVHYTPTSSSWLNLVERFFCEITRDCIRDGSFSSVTELEKANDCYIANRNANPKRIVWKAEGEAILRKINAARKALGMSPVDEKKPCAASPGANRRT